MLLKSAIIDIRKYLGIPEAGLGSEKEALAWYRDHFKQAKGEDLQGTFGFHYNHRSRLIDFEYKISFNSLQIYAPQPLDDAVPLDNKALTLASETDIPY
jgi:hypothetical protein